MLGHQLPAEMAFDAFEAALARMPEDEAWELIDGRVVVSDAGHTCGHNVLVQNIAFAMTDRFRAADAPHRPFVMTFYLKVPSLRSALLPHVMVRSGRLPPGATSCDDPVAIVEVCEMGQAGARADRWAVCRRLPTLAHYIVIGSAAPLVHITDRTGAQWREARVMDGLHTTLDLPSLDLSIPLAEIYRDVLDP